MPDAALLAIALNMVSTGFYDLLRLGARLDRSSRDKASLLRGEILESPIVISSLEAAIDRLLDVGSIDPAIGGEQLRSFLASESTQALVSQLFVLRASADDPSGREAAREQFVRSLAHSLGLTAEAAETHGARLFEALVASVDVGLSYALERNALPALEARSVLRHRLLSDQLTNIEKNLDLLRTEALPSRHDINGFAAEYTRQLVARDVYIVPPNLDRFEKRSVDDLYVAPLLTTGDADDRLDRVPYAQFAADFHRAVVLGNPGAGKSTLTLKICLDATTRPSRLSGRATTRTPILVVLREYAAAKSQYGWSILEYVTHTARNKYQLPEVPDHAFDFLLRNGEALVIFDGLDELLDTSARRDISADVEAFAAFYTTCPILVTSRRVGYEQAPLSPGTFVTWQLAEFDETRVSEYAQKWFAFETDLSDQERAQKIAAFLTESRVVPDLRVNPLMLGLMCNIYRGQGYIPSNRPDVFEACAVMLFDRWDKSRDIRVELPFESRLRPAMQYLAHWIYSNERFQAGVTRNRLVQQATDYLYPRRFEDIDEARAAAGAFIDFCRGRAWVFTDTGSTGVGDPLFQFTHRTFLEFFTADYLARTHVAPAMLFNTLAPHIELREWDVVSQLAIQLKTKYVEDAADELMALLLDRAESVPELSQAKNLLSFAVRSLEFLVPSPLSTRRVLTAAVSRALDEARQRWRPASNPAVYFGESVRAPVDEFVEGVLRAVASCNSEVFTTVSRALRDLLIPLIKGDDRDLAMVAAELALNVDSGLDPARASQAAAWETFTCQIIEECGPELRELARQSFRIGVDGVVEGLWSLSDFIESYHLQAVFVSCGYCLHANVQTIPLAALAIRGVFVRSGFPWIDERLGIFQRALGELGAALKAAEPPWVLRPTSPADAGGFGLMFEGSADAVYADELPADHTFAILVLAAICAELGVTGERVAPGLETFAASGSRVGEAAWTLYRQRGQATDEEVAYVEDVMRGDGASEVLTAWLGHKVSFVDSSTEDSESSGVQSSEAPQARTE